MAVRPTVAPVRELLKEGGHGWLETHPAYGVIRVHRISGSPGPLFGSVLPNHDAYMEIQIARADRKHHLSQDWIHGEMAPVLSIRLTYAQFVEMIANQNSGSGIPVTLSQRQDDAGRSVQYPGIEWPDGDQTEAAEVAKTFVAQGEALARKVKVSRQRMEVLVEKLPKKLQAEILGEFGKLETELRSNMPFYLQSLREVGEKVVSGVRTEVDAVITGAATRLGFKSLRDLARAIEARDPRRVIESDDE